MGYSLAYRNAGKGGERWAAAYLQSLGYRVLEANYRSRHREIDLIVPMLCWPHPVPWIGGSRCFCIPPLPDMCVSMH